MIELQEDELVFRFPDVHEDAVLRVDFQRTLRIPDDNRDYPLPPGLGSFPLVAAGKINALTGGRWRNELARRPQDYLVVPDQPWLDGFCVRKGIVRQFVAMPLGEGYSAEEQLTGAAEHGGLQIIVYPMKASIHKKMRESMPAAYDGSVVYSPSNYASMGLAPGGLMRQEIFEDDYGFDAWDTSVSSRCFVHVLNSIQYLAVCGVEPPDAPPRAADYTDAGLPWFEYYGGDLKALEGSAELAGLDSVAAKRWKAGESGLGGNDPVQPKPVKKLNGSRVREGEL